MFVNMAGFTVEYQAVILNDIGVKNLLGLVSPELTLASKLDIASVFDGLLMDSMYTHAHTRTHCYWIVSDHACVSNHNR
jgi:hypothetical protein